MYMFTRMTRQTTAIPSVHLTFLCFTIYKYPVEIFRCHAMPTSLLLHGSEHDDISHIYDVHWQRFSQRKPRDQ